MKYYIDFGTGTGNIEFTGTLEQAFEKADNNSGYTQESIAIYSEDKDCWIRQWSSCEYDEESGFEYDEIIDYGRFGFYTPWEYQF